MAISGSELLDVLDIIRNEDTYNDKIKELRKEQQKLNEARYIAQTVEIANKYYEDAKTQREKYSKQLQSAEADATKLVKQAKEEASGLLAKAKDKLSVAEQIKKEAQELYEKNRLRLLDLEEKEKQTAHSKNHYETSKERADNIRSEYEKKVKQLKMVIDGSYKN